MGISFKKGKTKQSKRNKPRIRSRRGTVGLQEFQYTRRFKYTYDSAPGILTLPRSGILSQIFEENLRLTIQSDILNKRYDTTKKKYNEIIAEELRKATQQQPDAATPATSDIIAGIEILQQPIPAMLDLNNMLAAKLTIEEVKYLVQKALAVLNLIQTRILSTPSIVQPDQPQQLQPQEIQPQAIQEPQQAQLPQTAQVIDITANKATTASNSPVTATQLPDPEPEIHVQEIPPIETGIRTKKRSRTNDLGIPKLDDVVFNLDEVIKRYCELNTLDMTKDYYKSPYIMAGKWGEITFEVVPGLLAAMNYADETYVSRKHMLSAMFTWLVKRGRLEYNPFEDVPPKKLSKIKPAHRQRLTDYELRQILDAIKDDRFVHKYSHRAKHSDYYPIFLFLSVTGARPAEGIGLQVKKLNQSCTEVMIDEALARSTGSYAKGRIRKSTKNESKRIIKITDPELIAILQKLCEGKEPDDLVFLSACHKSVNDTCLNGVLKTVLKKLKIAHRVLYVLRHCFASRCFQNGMSYKVVQALMGHFDHRTLLAIYAEVTLEKHAAPKIDGTNKN
jgi:integrase